jgi:hypothetical protein
MKGETLMAETLFGSVSPLWSAMPGPVFGYGQTPMTTAGRINPGVGLQGTAAAATPFGIPTPNAITNDPYGNFTGGNAIAGFMPGAEIGVGVTAPALLAAVAVRRGQPLGPTNDQEIEDFIYDALELLPGANDVEIKCEGGKTTVTGSVPHKRLKRDVGEIAWAIPNVIDVQNNITIAQRRRPRTQGRENEPQSVAARKQA